MTAAERTTMTDKTPPYVTTFDQIKPGQLIEREWAFRGIRFRTEGIAHHLSPDSEGQWLTVDGGIVANRPDSTDALRVLAEPPKPSPPTEPGTVVLAGGEPWFRGETRWWSLDSRKSCSPAEMAEKDWTLAKIVPAEAPSADA